MNILTRFIRKTSAFVLFVGMALILSGGCAILGYLFNLLGATAWGWPMFNWSAIVGAILGFIGWVYLYVSTKDW